MTLASHVGTRGVGTRRLAEASATRYREGLMSRSLVVLGAVALCATPIGCTSRDPVPPGPLNVVLISIDTLRADRLNSYGYSTRKVSPEIDRLANEGILFETHITASPWTTPAHLSLLTGLSPSAHGVIAAISQIWDRLRFGRPAPRLADEHQTLAEVLSARGYATGAFTGGRTVDPRIGFDQGFDVYDTSQAKLLEGGLVPVTDWIEAHREGPFFLFWHTFEVHAPYLRTDLVRDVVSDEEARRLEAAFEGLEVGRPRVPLEEKKARRRLMRLQLHTLEVCSALYDGGILSADGAVGAIMRALKRAGVYERTLVVVTSDHGEQFGEKKGEGGLAVRDGGFYNAHGKTVYEESIHVPLILKLPGGRPAGRRVADVTRAIDVMPTILDVLAIPGPEAMQGASLRPLWEGRWWGGAEPRKAFTEALTAPFESKSLRSGRYKYVLSFDGDRVVEHGRAAVLDRADVVELYDLRADPGEQHNLMVDPSPETEALAKRYDAELRRVAAERIGKSDEVVLDRETLEQIKALGYAE
jgi:arylsulfatase A-like enzyme